MACLDGLLVVALEQAATAPFGTQPLVDAGARGYHRAVGGESAYFVWSNHGKQSVVLDIERAEGGDPSRHPALRRPRIVTEQRHCDLPASPIGTGGTAARSQPVPGIGAHIDIIRKEFA